MKSVENFERWSEQHHSAWLDILRIALGLTLQVKGFIFIMDTSSLVKMLNEFHLGGNTVVLAQFIAIMHLVTGLLIMAGLGTRISCLVQIPIVLGAVFFVITQAGVTNAGELILSIVVLVLLFFFLIRGSGKFSVYYYLINSKRSRLTDESESDYQGGSSVAPMDREANIL